MQSITYTTRGTCSRRIEILIEDGIIADVHFLGGCSGNLQGISKLVKGMPAKKAADLLRGIDCGGRGTSCPDQLALAIDEYAE